MEKAARDALQRRLTDRRLPPMIILDITNTCNLACIHCPQPLLQASADFKSRHMSWDHFTKIIDEIATIDEPVLLRFTGDGEPTVHPKLFDMLALAKERCGATVNLTTNATKLTPKRIDALLAQGVDVIDISIDALSEATYDQVRKGGDFKRLNENIDYLLGRRGALNAPTKVMVSFIKQDANQHEADDFAAYWDTRVDEVMIRSMHSAVGMVKNEESKRLNNAEDQGRYPCPHLWKRLTIDFNGDVKFCAHEWVGNTDVLLGNIADAPLVGIWQGPHLSDIRARHNNDDHREGFICTTCSDWAAARWDWGYERLIDRVVHGEAKLMPEFSSDQSTQT